MFNQFKFESFADLGKVHYRPSVICKVETVNNNNNNDNDNDNDNNNNNNNNNKVFIVPISKKFQRHCLQDVKNRKINMEKVQ